MGNDRKYGFLVLCLDSSYQSVIRTSDFFFNCSIAAGNNSPTEKNEE